MTPQRIQETLSLLRQGGASGAQIEKWQRLVEILKTCSPALVAFSGGVDSSFLAYSVHLVQGSQMLAVTLDSGLDAPEQRAFAVQLAGELGFPHRVMELDAMQVPDITANSPERCYFCKKMILSRLWEVARQEGYAAVLEGQNMDDQDDYRPGRRAVQETGTRSPLAESGLTKAEIRLLSQILGLKTWDRPSAPCLATRFPYHVPLTIEGLAKIAAGEKYLKSLGFENCRVRYYGDMARIEVPPDEIERLAALREQVAAFFKTTGFTHIALDLEGYRQGSMNEGLPQ